MTATARGFPYALATDAIGDWPAVSLALANLLEAGNDELGYSPFTGVVSITVSTEATAALVVALPSITFTGANDVEIEFYSPRVTPGPVAGASIQFVLWDSVAAASIGLLGTVLSQVAASQSFPVLLKRRLTPAAGARTYSIRAFRGGGSNGSVGAGAGGAGVDVPGFVKATVV